MWFFWTLRVLLQRWCSTCLVLVNTPTPRENRERQESRIFLNLQKNTIFNEHPVPLFSKENIFSWDGKMVNWMVKIFTKAIVWMCAINSARDDLSLKAPKHTTFRCVLKASWSNRSKEDASFNVFGKKLWSETSPLPQFVAPQNYHFFDVAPALLHYVLAFLPLCWSVSNRLHYM